MGLLLRFGILITPSLGFQFSSVTGLTIITASKLMNLVLHSFFLGFALLVINSYLSKKKKRYNLLLNFFLYLWRLRDFINLIYISI